MPLAPPASANPVGPSLAAAPDGTVWLTWLESSDAPAKTTALRFSTFDPAQKTWRQPQTIASGVDWFVGNSDFPALAAGASGRATAFWLVKNPPTPETAHLHHGAGYHALLSSTADGGETWSAATPLSRESNTHEFVSVAALADGRVLATWLDAREKIAHGKPQRLYGRIVGSEGRDVLIDDSVCDCCHTSLTAFPDGSALLAYRGRSSEEVRDIRTARFRGAAWDESRILHADDWRIDGCPVNGPQIASDGGRVAAVWFTAAEKQARVLASSSPDAGARFLMPLRIDAGQPLGRVDTVLLRDGALLVTWVENDGGLWLRRISPDFTAGEPTALARGGKERVKGVPRIALARDYAGGPTAAELVVAYTVDGTPAELRTLHATIPEGALLQGEKNCDCAPTPEQLRGYAFRGTIVRASGAAAALEVKHPEIPGIFPAGTREFRVAAELLPTAEPGRELFGRVEPRDGTWWLFDVRFVAQPARSP